MIKKHTAAKLGLAFISFGLIVLLVVSFWYFKGWKRLGLGNVEVQQNAARMNADIPTSAMPQPQVESELVGESETDSSQEPPQDEVELESFPSGKLWISAGRRAYINGTLRLIVPELQLDTLIQNGTEPEQLEKGPGLYDYAQMPNEQAGSNVCIAGYRDSFGSPFLKLDTLEEGDLFYLIYEGVIYTYTFESVQIVASDDWSPIRTKGYSALTLTSGDPIGSWENRIVVTARMTGKSSDEERFFLPEETPDEVGAASGSALEEE